MKKVRFMASILAATLVATCFVGCGETETTGTKDSTTQIQEAKESTNKVTKEGFPIVEEPITIKIFCAKPDGTPQDFNEMKFFKEYAEKTNVNIDWDLASGDAFTERLNVLIATEDLPDAIMKGYISDIDVTKQVKYGTYQDVSQMLPEYAPNLNSYLESDPTIKKGLTIEGGIYGLPYLCESEVIRTRKMYINQKWLDAVGAKMPTNLDEFYEVLKLFRDKDPNGNGEQDEIPFAAQGIGTLKEALYGAFGLMNRGLSNGGSYIDEDPVNPGQVRFFRASEGMKENLMFLNKLYNEKLIDPNIFAIKSADFYAYAAMNRVGSHMVLPPLIGPEYCDDFIPLDAPLQGPNGDQIWGSIIGKLFTKNCLLITKANKYPEATLRWADYFYSEQGSIEYFLGEEGVTYDKTPEGKYEYTDYVLKNPDGQSLDDVISKYSIYAGGANPAVLTNDNFKGAEMYPSSIEGTPNFLAYAPEVIWEEFVFTPDEASELSEIKSEITTLIGENEAKFITGETPFSEWDNYVKSLEKAGLSRYLEIYQQAYERYMQ